MSIRYSVDHAAAPALPGPRAGAARRVTAGRARPRPPPRRGAWLKHAAVTQERIEDAGEAAGESDNGDVLAAAGRDVQGPGVEGLGLGGATAEDGDRGLNEQPAGAARPGLGDGAAAPRVAG